MSIAHGLSLGLFIIVAIAIGWIVFVIAFSTAIQVMQIRAGAMKFTQASALAQSVYLFLFPDGGDAGGFA